jgi:hypothetical protein
VRSSDTGDERRVARCPCDNQRITLGVNDDQRMVKATKGLVGKRLTYRRTRRPQETEEPEIPF